MGVKRKTVLIVLWTLLALWLFSIWFKSRNALPPNNFQLSFACNGKADEKRFLIEQANTIVDNSMRCIISQDRFITYRIPVGNCEPQRAFWAINQVGFRLEFSPDGKEWSPLLYIGKLPQGNPKRLSRQGCGFHSEQKKAASESGVAYFRFRVSDELQDSYPAIKYFGLQVSGSRPPQHFRRPSVGREILKNVVGLLPTKLMVLVGLGSIIICKRCWKAPWRLFGIGVLLWIISVAAKFAWAFLTNKPVGSTLHTILPPLPADLIFWAYLGLLTGIFECGIFLPLAKYIRQKKWTWNYAASLGVGFGAVEAVAAAIALAASARMQSHINLGLDAPSFIGPVERLITLVVHTASVVMIIYALTNRKWAWFIASFLYKSGIDAVAAFVLLSGIGFLKTHLWFVELCLFAPFAFAGLCLLLVLRRLWQLQIDEMTGKEPPSEN
ncbi:MAG: YhfC family glutamic-type intramembrane protease [Phycisphaerae bacterium]